MTATIVCTHMMLEAWDIGIGSCWVLLFDPAEVIRAFNLPPYIVSVCFLPIGYPAPGAKPYASWHNTFRPLADTVEII